jgi:hypothetical protein
MTDFMEEFNEGLADSGELVETRALAASIWGNSPGHCLTVGAFEESPVGYVIASAARAALCRA